MIKIKGLDFTGARNWLKKAGDCQKQDPVASFIFAWISFNHYYATFALENADEFKEWSHQLFGGRQGDKAELFFLAQTPGFVEAYVDFKSRYPKHLTSFIDLPVIDMVRNSRVPENVRGRKKFADLTITELLGVIYQIRNNLFHGSKDPTKSERDLALCVSASQVMIPLTAFLLNNTYGEVRYGHDDGQELRKEVEQLFEA